MTSTATNWRDYSRAEIRATLFSNDYDRAIELITFLGAQPDNPYIDALITLLEVSDQHWIRVALADAFYELADPRTLPPLLQAIATRPKEDATYALVRACTQFDCSPYLDALVEQVIQGQVEGSAWALIAIRQMPGPFEPQQLLATIQAIKLVKKGSPNKLQLRGVLHALQAKQQQ